MCAGGGLRVTDFGVVGAAGLVPGASSSPHSLEREQLGWIHPSPQELLWLGLKVLGQSGAALVQPKHQPHRSCFPSLFFSK
jgi:hypothetical protein